MATVQEPKAGNRFESFVEAELGRARRRIQAQDIGMAALGLLAGTLAYALGMVVLDRWLNLSDTTRQIGLFTFLAAAIAYAAVVLTRPLRREVNPYFAARRVERAVPGSKNSVVSWLDLHDEPLPASIRAAVSQKAATDLKRADVDEVVRDGRLAWVGGVAGGLFVAALILFFLFRPNQFLSLLGRAFTPFGSGAIAKQTTLNLLNPASGDVTIPVNSLIDFQVEVLGRVPDPTAADAVRLRFRYNPADPVWEEIRLDPSPREPREFSVRMPAGRVQNGFVYQIVGGDAATPEHRVAVRSSALIEGFEIVYHFRSYLRFRDQTVVNPNIAALRGTQVTLTARTNRNVNGGILTFLPIRDGQKTPAPITAEVVPGQPTALRFRFVLEEDAKYTISFASVEGEKNEDPIPYTIKVLSDHAPQVEVTQPAPDALPVNGTLSLEGKASDDFGITIMRLCLQLADGEQPTALAPKPYRPGKVFKFADDTYPRALDYKDFLPLDQLKTADGKPIALKPGLVIEYWLEAEDNCDYPKPNIGKSSVYRVKLGDPQEGLDKQAGDKQAAGEKAEHDKNQDEKLARENEQKQKAGNEGDKGEPNPDKQADPQPNGTEPNAGEPKPADAAEQQALEEKVRKAQEVVDRQAQREKDQAGKGEAKDNPPPQPGEPPTNPGEPKAEQGDNKNGNPQGAPPNQPSQPKGQHGEAKPDPNAGQPQPNGAKAENKPDGQPNPGEAKPMQPTAQQQPNNQGGNPNFADQKSPNGGQPDSQPADQKPPNPNAQQPNAGQPDAKPTQPNGNSTQPQAQPNPGEAKPQPQAGAANAGEKKDQPQGDTQPGDAKDGKSDKPSKPDGPKAGAAGGKPGNQPKPGSPPDSNPNQSKPGDTPGQGPKQDPNNPNPGGAGAKGAKPQDAPDDGKGDTPDAGEAKPKNNPADAPAKGEAKPAGGDSGEKKPGKPDDATGQGDVKNAPKGGNDTAGTSPKAQPKTDGTPAGQPKPGGPSSDQPAGNDQKQTDELTKLAQDLKSGDAKTRQAAEDKIKEMAKQMAKQGNGQKPPDPQAVKAAEERVQEMLKQLDKDPDARRALENAVKKAGEQIAQEELQQLAQDLKSGDAKTREAAQQRARQLAQGGLKPIADAARSADPQQRQKAEEALKQIEPDGQARQALLDALKGGDKPPDQHDQPKTPSNQQQFVGRAPDEPPPPSTTLPETGPAPDPKNKDKTSDLQLERFPKNPSKELLQDLGMTEEQYRQFLKDAAELQRKRDAEAKNNRQRGATRGATAANSGAKAVQGGGDKTTPLERGGAPLPPAEYRDGYKGYTEDVSKTGGAKKE
jgi:collagen type III alpha